MIGTFSKGRSIRKVALTQIAKRVLRRNPDSQCHTFSSQSRSASRGDPTVALHPSSSTGNSKGKHTETRQSVVRRKAATKEHVGSVFLEKVRDGRVPKDLVCQRAKEVLTQMAITGQQQADGQANVRDGRLALDMLNISLENANLPNEPLIPKLFSLVCQIMLQSGQLKEVDTLLHRLLDNHVEFLVKDDITYNSLQVNDACSQYINEIVLLSNRSRRKLSGSERQRILRLLNRLQDLYNDEAIPLTANEDWCNANVMFYCNQNMPQEAHKHLRWMVEQTDEHQVKITPPVMSFTATIAAYAKTDPDKSLELLQWMLSMYKKRQKDRKNCNNMPEPNSSCFNGVLDAWARSGRRDAGLKAEQTIDWMQQLHDTEGLPTKPDDVSYNSCINAWANSSHPDAPTRAEAILRKMVAMYQSGNEIVLSNFTFTSVMNAWANSQENDAPARISDLLDLLNQMASQVEDLEVNSFCYSVYIKAWEQVGRAKKKERGFNDLYYLDKIIGVLRQMDEQCVEKTAGLHNTVIMALLEFSAISAVLHFLELEEMYRQGQVNLNTRTFNSGLTALAALNKPDVADRSMDIFHRMVEYSHTNSDVQPDQTTYNLLLKVLSRSPAHDAAEKSEQLLKDMESQKYIKASTTSYVTVVIAWGRSQDSGKLLKVQDLLGRYRELVESGAVSRKTPPNVFNAALSVCQHNASAELSDQVLETIMFTLKELRTTSRIQPDHNTYLTLFRALGNLSEVQSQERDELLESEFAECIKEGLASREILESLHNASPAVFKKIFGAEETPQSFTIPPSWSKRAR